MGLPIRTSSRRTGVGVKTPRALGLHLRYEPLEFHWIHAGAPHEAAGDEGQTLVLELNGRVALNCPLTPQLRRCEGIAGSPLFRAGRNEIRVRVEPVNPMTRDARLYSIDLTPRRNAVEPKPEATPDKGSQARD